MAKKFLKNFNTDLSEWYNDVVLKAQLADYAPIKGCMVIRPYGLSLWKNIQSYLGKLIQEHGVEDAYFPLFIPMRFFEKEKEHVEGFSPELAVVTHGGGEELAEKLAVRPTSETIMYEMYRQWYGSWRDLPVKLNQWCNMVRWEKRTYMFLRTSEFLWQEGHCAHLTHEESMKTVFWALDAYEQTYNNLLAMYGIKGIKSDSEKFAGAGDTFTFEIMMPNGKSLQGCTSHDLAQNFSKSFDWTVQDQNGKNVNPWQNSWGFSTRSIGGLIMAHGDENGLRLPPNIAPIQIVIVTMPGHDQAKLLAEKIYADFQSLYRIKLDDDQNTSAGFKFNQWELKGVPLRIEIGNREAEASQVTIYRRDTGEKQTIHIDQLTKVIDRLLVDIQEDMFANHRKFTQDHTFSVDSYDDFKNIMATSKGFVMAHWCGKAECEASIKSETKATTRCRPLDAKIEEGKCIYCGDKSQYRWIFAQSY